MRQASHGLRGSLGIATGAAQLLQLPAKKEERTEFLAMLSRNLHHTGHLLNQLLDYAHLKVA